METKGTEAYRGMPGHFRLIVNVGLDDGLRLEEAIPRFVVAMELAKSVNMRITQETIAIRFDARARSALLTPGELALISSRLGEDCIAYRFTFEPADSSLYSVVLSEGLVGPRTDKWEPFDLSKFVFT